MRANSPFDLVNAVFPPGEPRLGLGCGDLSPQHDRANAIYQVEQAYEAGFRYFDTARLYGNGQCEGVLGDVLATCRQDVIIATKVGILPWSMHRKRDRLKAKIGQANLPAALMNAYSLDDLKRSFEYSMRELKTDYVDILFLYECSLEHVLNDEIQQFLEGQLKDGSVRAVGIATSFENTCAIQDHGLRPNIIQGPHDSVRNQIRDYKLDDDQLLIAHSALVPALQPLSHLSASNPRFIEDFTQAIGVDPRDEVSLAPLLMALAMRDNPNGVSLASGLKPYLLAAVRQTISYNALPKDRLQSLANIMKGFDPAGKN